jgi:RHS repeat-associated protein
MCLCHHFHIPRPPLMNRYRPLYQSFAVVVFRRGVQRYGFNGKEFTTQDHTFDSSSTLDFGERNYIPTLARFISIDPKPKHIEGPYTFVSNSPNYLIDPNGADTLVVHFGRAIRFENSVYLYPLTFSLIQNGIERQVEITLPDEMITSKLYAVVPIDVVEGNLAGNKIVRDNQELFEIRFEEYKGYRNSIRLKQFKSGSRVLFHTLNGTGGSAGCHTPRAGNPEDWETSEYRINDALVFSYRDATLSDGTQQGQAVLDGIRQLHEETIGGKTETNSLGREVLVPNEGNNFMIKTNSTAPMARIKPIEATPLPVSQPTLIK